MISATKVSDSSGFCVSSVEIASGSVYDRRGGGKVVLTVLLSATMDNEEEFLCPGFPRTAAHGCPLLEQIRMPSLNDV